MDRRAWAVVGAVVVLAAGLSIAFLVEPSDDNPHTESTAVVVEDGAAADGRQTIEFQGVMVDLPENWQRVDNSNCGIDLEQWAPTSAQTCAYDGGVTFMNSGSYDSRYNPGLRRSRPDEPSRWSGYVLVRPLAVFVAAGDMALARRLLQSAR